jgi:hypothetical protein
MTVRDDDCSPDDDYHLPLSHDSGDSRSFALRWTIITVQKSGSRFTRIFRSDRPLPEDNPIYTMIIGIIPG